MAAPDDAARWGTAGSRVNISGDAQLARDLERLFSQLDPDWEGRLSRILGDVWGHQIASGLRAGAEQFRESAGSAGDMVSEYLRRPQGAVAQADEIKEFSEAVDELTEGVAEVEARLRTLTGDD
jgi:ubiquinone biosynthesis protein UbiJ